MTLSEQPSSQISDDKNWSQASPTQLIDHILARYHQVHREQLPELISLATRVEQVHGEHADCPKGLAQQLAQMEQELLSHMHKEEQILFPMLSAGHGAMAGGPISVMRHEHQEHTQAIEQLKTRTGNFTPPVGACNTWRKLYNGLQVFVEDLQQHIELENTILFEC